MPQMKFDKRSLDKLPLVQSGQVDYFDTATPGLGLRVGTRSKTFFVKTDVKDPTKRSGYRTVKQTLGRYGDMTLEQARKELAGYDHPEQGFIPGKRLEIKRGEHGDSGKRVTVGDMLDFYFKEKKRKDGKPFKPGSAKSYTRIIQRHFPAWLPLTLPEFAKLTPETVIQAHTLDSQKHGPYGAKNAFVMLTAIINYAMIRHPSAIHSNPLNVLRQGKHLPKVNSRTERLEGKDFKVFLEGLQKFNEITRDAYLFCLYHGLRPMEGAALRWEHIDLEKEELQIPDTKNRYALYAPLSRQSLAILQRRTAANAEGSAFVFPAVREEINKTGHVRLQAEKLRLNTGLKLTVQGLRRTFITTGRRLKMYEDADRLTNHVDSSVSGKHYDGTGVDDLRVPLQKIANEMERLMVEGVGGKVIQLPMAGVPQ